MDEHETTPERTPLQEMQALLGRRMMLLLVLLVAGDAVISSDLSEQKQHNVTPATRRWSNEW